MPKIRATKEVKYASVLRHPGDVFDVPSERDAKLIIAIGKGEIVPAGKSAKAKAAEPAPEPAPKEKVEPEKAKPEPKDEPAAEPETKPVAEPAKDEQETEAETASKRKYTRRDMTAGS